MKTDRSKTIKNGAGHAYTADIRHYNAPIKSKVKTLPDNLHLTFSQRLKKWLTE